MKAFQSLIVTALVLSATGAIAAQGVYGSWKFPQIVSGPLTIDSTLTFTKDSVIEHSICTVDGKTAEVSVTVPVSITDSQISVLAAAQNDVNKDGVDCHASIDPSSMGYSVSADDASLTLSMPGQGSITLPRQ